MSLLNHQLELLAPARDAAIGIEAINHGADAVYIGGPGFGARVSASNSVQEIERLARHAHRFGARIFVTHNTILRDDELEAARRMAWDVYHAGADVLIVQDMGLLELDLPPIQLHASTQTDIRTAAKAKFLQDVGFSQIVLARELTLEQKYQALTGKLTTGNVIAPIAKSKLDGDRITFTAAGAEYTGRVTGNTMEGTRKAGGTETKWRANRVKS